MSSLHLPSKPMLALLKGHIVLVEDVQQHCRSSYNGLKYGRRAVKQCWDFCLEKQLLTFFWIPLLMSAVVLLVYDGIDCFSAHCDLQSMGQWSMLPWWERTVCLSHTVIRNCTLGMDFPYKVRGWGSFVLPPKPQLARSEDLKVGPVVRPHASILQRAWHIWCIGLTSLVHTYIPDCWGRGNFGEKHKRKWKVFWRSQDVKEMNWGKGKRKGEWSTSLLVMVQLEAALAVDYEEHLASAWIKKNELWLRPLEDKNLPGSCRYSCLQGVVA